MIADQIRSVLRAKADALIRRDAAGLATLLHSDFVYLNARGEIFNKADYIDAYCVSGRVIFREQQILGLRVTQFDGFAVATFALNDRFLVSEQVIEGSYRSLCVFNASANGWQWAAGQTMTHSQD